MSTTTHEALAGAIREAAVLRGEFTLRSGATSNYYVDKYRFTTKPELLRAITELLVERIRDIDAAEVRGTGGDRGVDRLAGAELGGIPLVTAAGLALSKPFVFIRNSKKEYGTAKRLEGELTPTDRVVLLEDIATTGGQSVEAVETLREAGAEVLAVIAVVDRLEGARQNIERAGVRFEALLTKRDLGIEE
ncbi:MAG: orotate phosphoribosyltransferase [Phycisphaeraceae bacterium]|nr:orotate phosphoribosyltransferase [Phycisphaeraceae bacterium]MCB9847200.1 orotate phosphoribosyltransferase [Phycisphaeraceae bacterium]